MSFVDPAIINFMGEKSLQERSAISKNTMRKYPDYVPVIVGRANLTHTPPIDKFKFLAPKCITLGAFICEIRRHIKINETEALFFFLPNNTLISPCSLMDSLHEKYKSDDGFLYMQYSCENTFGTQ